MVLPFPDKSGFTPRVGGCLLIVRCLMRVLRILSFLVLLAFLSGCEKVDFAALVAQPLTISVFKGGRPVSERHLSPPSSEHDQLTAWFSQHQSNWHSSYVTYAPGVLVSGTNFELNIQHLRVIINTGGRQLERDADDADFQFLLHKPGT
jgi:hypothetical protein